MNANADNRTVMRIWMNIERITSSKLDSREEKWWESMRFKGDSTVGGFVVYSYWEMVNGVTTLLGLVLFFFLVLLFLKVLVSSCQLVQLFIFFFFFCLFFYLLRNTILLFNINFILKLLYHQIYGNMHL